eukprot:COSAG05_NODE_2478_length_3011_cov_2.418613_1_plen_58_part_00
MHSLAGAQVRSAETGEKEFVTAPQPSLLKAMLSLQRLPDLRKCHLPSKPSPFACGFH